MRRLFTESQLAHQQRRDRLFLSPEAQAAAAADPLIAEVQGLAALDHAFKGWKNLESRGIDGRSGKPISTFSLAVDDPIELSRGEVLEAQIKEVQNAIANGEQVGAFRDLTPEQREWYRGLIQKHIAPGEINTIGRLGTNKRTFPKDYKDPALAGTQIPVNWKDGQMNERGTALLLDKVEGMDPDTGVSLYGVDIDAMHRQPAAEFPELVAEVSNIKMGPTSMNQSDGRRTGEDLVNSRKSRLQNLQAARFLEENGIPIKQRGGIDPVTNKENLAATKLHRELDKLLADVRSS